MNTIQQRNARLVEALRDIAMQPCNIPFQYQRSEFELPGRDEKREAFYAGWNQALASVHDTARALLAEIDKGE